MSNITVYYHAEDRLGWAPITHMANLATRLLGARMQDVTGQRATTLGKVKLALSRSPHGGDEIGIFIARRPKEVNGFACLPAFSSRHKLRVLWIIDSFRTSQLASPRIMSHFDVIAYTQAYDAPFYEAHFGSRALFLGWGADALDLGSMQGTRPVDVLRVGRQPAQWDDDAATAELCKELGLCFHGRPPQTEDPADQLRALMQDWYGRAKYVIAHSNLAAPADYTHSEKEYITGRWTDALASGASIAGVQPRTDLGLLNWPEALIDFDKIDLRHNLAALREAVSLWTPAIARANHLGALRNLDWRWRIKALADRIGVAPAPLTAEITRLTTRIDSLAAESVA